MTLWFCCSWKKEKHSGIESSRAVTRTSKFLFKTSDLLSSLFQDLEEGNILDPVFQQRLEDARVLLRQEIQKELKIKEAAERMRRAITNRKSAADVDGQLRASRRKLEKLHSELQEVNARAMAPEKDSNTAG